MKPATSICIFMSSGRTFTFHGVKIISDNENAIRFSYTAMSDGKEKIADFYKWNIVGVSRFS